MKFLDPSYTVEGRKLGRVRIQTGLVLQSPRFSAPDARMGALYAAERTTFRIFAPTARSVRVVVAPFGEGGEGMVEHGLTRAGHGLWEVEVPGDLAGRYYAWKLAGPGFDAAREIGDVYATCAQGNRPRCLIVDLQKTDPPGFRNNPYRRARSPVDVVIYEIHVRDFTIATNSGAAHRGQYLGLAEAGTRLPGHPEIRTGLDHLRELGVTHVQLMPVQDFDNGNEESDSAYNWGYMPMRFNSPEGWFATGPAGAARIIELKRAIQALHEAGIGVTLDVVYNHTSPRADFERLVPGYYFRTDRRGRCANGSGCGNEFRSESSMGRKIIIDSLTFWVREYQVDGFRFDLMGLMDIDTLKAARDALWKIDRNILLYGEAWTAGPSPLRERSDRNRVRGTGIGAFNDEFRDAIKGDREGGVPGFIQTGDRADQLRRGLAGATDGWPEGPIDTVNYFECHDNLTAWDKLRISTPGAFDATRERMMRFGALILFASQGRVFIQAGQEFCRGKKGHPNTYNQPDDINQIDWSGKVAHRTVYAYFQGLIAFRAAHPALRLASAAEVRRRVSFPEAPSPRSVVYEVDGQSLSGESARSIRVLLNGERTDVDYTLPEGTWTICADADRAGLAPLKDVSGKLTLPAHSGVLLVR